MTYVRKLRTSRHHEGHCGQVSGEHAQDWKVTISKKAFDKIAEGLNEALAIARGQKKPAKLYVPSEIDVRAIRSKLELSQDDFASSFGFSLNQIKDWEQRRSRPLGGVRAYLLIIDRDPKGVLKILQGIKPKAKQKAAA